MIRRAKLYVRTNEGNGKFPRLPVEFDRNGRPIAPQGNVTSYLVRIAGKFEDAGDDLQNAVTFLRQRQAAIGNGIEAPEALPSVKSIQDSEPGKTRLANAAEDYKSELRTLDKSNATVLVYSNALDGFVQSCRKQFIEDIERKDILTYIQWMRENLDTRVAGGQNSTINNRLTYLGTFLGRHGVKLFKDRNRNGANDPGLLFSSDRLKEVKKAPKKHSRENIDLLMKHADLNQKDYLEFLLWSGFRDEEVQYLTYADFDFKNNKVGVHAKPQFGWKPKDSEERTVKIPTAVTQRIKDRMARPVLRNKVAYTPTMSDLVFPNSDGRPDSHLIYRLHAVAEKAGLDLKGKRAGHMFRKNAGTRVQKRFGLDAAMRFLGHSDIETTARYLASDDDDSKESRQMYEEMYAQGD